MEYIEGLKWKQDKNGQLNLKLINPEAKEVYDNPLTLVDGLPLANANELIDYDPLKLEKISLINKEFYFGKKQYGGVVSLST